jgi:hypothetical protein
VGGAFRCAEIRIGSFVGDIDQVGETQVLDLPSTTPISGVVPFSVKSVLRDSEVKILWQKARVYVYGGVFVVPRDVERSVVHDVIKVDPEAKTVGDFHQVEELGFGSITS